VYKGQLNIYQPVLSGSIMTVPYVWRCSFLFMPWYSAEHVSSEHY